MTKSKCLGFWESGAYKVQNIGIASIYEISIIDTFPCVPVSELKKAISKRKRHMKKQIKIYKEQGYNKYERGEGWLSALEAIEYDLKELGLNQKVEVGK